MVGPTGLVGRAPGLLEHSGRTRMAAPTDITYIRPKPTLPRNS